MPPLILAAVCLSVGFAGAAVLPRRAPRRWEPGRSLGAIPPCATLLQTRPCSTPRRVPQLPPGLILAKIPHRCLSPRQWVLQPPVLDGVGGAGWGLRAPPGWGLVALGGLGHGRAWHGLGGQRVGTQVYVPRQGRGAGVRLHWGVLGAPVTPREPGEGRAGVQPAPPCLLTPLPCSASHGGAPSLPSLVALAGGQAVSTPRGCPLPCRVQTPAWEPSHGC